MGKPCCCNGCSCYSFEVTDWDAAEWVVVWDYDSQPQGADAITFNGTDVTIEIDYDNPDRANGAAIGVTLLHREWLAKAWDIACPFYWGTQGVMEALNEPAQGCDVTGYPTLRFGVARIYSRDDVEPDNVLTSLQQLFWPDTAEAFEWRLGNATSGITLEGPQRYGLERYGLRFEVQPAFGTTAGTVQWKISAPVAVKIGCCDLPRYELPAAFTNWDRAFVFRSDALWDIDNVVLTADPYAPGEPCDPIDRFENQPEAGEADLVATADGLEQTTCDNVDLRFWTGSGTIAVANRLARGNDTLFCGTSTLTRLSTFEGDNVRSRSVFIVHDPLAAAPDDWLVVEFTGAFPTGTHLTATWDSVGEVRTSAFVLNGGTGLRRPIIQICPPDGAETLVATYHYGPTPYLCQYDGEDNYAFYDIESVLQQFANPTLPVTIGWNAYVNRLQLTIQNVVAYTANADQLDGLDGSGSLTFTRNNIATGAISCDCAFPNTLTLNVISMS